MKTYLASIATIVLFLPTISFAQFNHDVGLKISTNEYERFHLEYRWHPNETWALTASLVYGDRYDYYSYSNREIVDSTMEIFSNSGQTKSYNLSVGALRKLTFMKHNYYYIGGNVGAGRVIERHSSYRELYFLDSTALTYGVYQPGEQIEGSEAHANYNLFTVTSRLYLGADVPLLDRLTLNMECGLGAALSFYPNSSVYLNSRLYASAGLRYRFGRDLKE